MKNTRWPLAVLLWLPVAGVCWAHDAGPSPVLLEDETIDSKLDVKLRGYFKLDLSYDDAATVPGDYVKWVERGASGEDDGFSGTLNQSRLALDVQRPIKGGGELGGRVEIDFFGGGDGADPRIRHAYVEASWPEAGIDLLIGQTSDVISPLSPSTLNYTVAWWAGNIGYRRPQLRLTKTYVIPRRPPGSPGPLAQGAVSTESSRDDISVQLAAALTRNIYDTKVGSVTGEDAGFPALQARASVTFPGFGARPTTLGVSGHRAQEDFVVQVSDVVERCDSWSLNLDVSVPITGTVKLQSELWSGAGLAPYLGGVGQGVDLETQREIRSRGGWIAASFAPVGGKCNLSVGLSIDDADDRDIAAGGRGSNRSIFGNLVYAFNRHVDLGVELSHWRTEYAGLDDAKALRTQTSIFYKF